ncbi:MAG: D-alanyl-D-alanine endopeptidase (penicillin-binding protein 7), partial [bacterium]
KSTATTHKTGSKKARKGTRRASVAPVVFDPARPATLRAESAVVLDRRTRNVIWGKNPDERRPVASLTKLMTALVVIESPLSMDDSITVTTVDVTGAGRSRVRAGNRVSIGDLFHCSLISSDNAATRTLARATGLSTAEFVARMNQRATELGMERTHYAEMTGLDAGNVSTARDQARVLEAAYSDPMIASLLGTESHSFRCGKRTETLNNTNRLLRSRTDVAGGKTGFTRPAGYCLATQCGNAAEPSLTTVVLGAPSSSSRFSESAKLIDWAKKSMDPLAGTAATSHR